ncbi:MULTISPECIES: serine/threonine-protein kinase [Corynebacterium]|nr:MULTISPECIES: serine/threonine-protein kinase [Corynebacterium]
MMDSSHSQLSPTDFRNELSALGYSNIAQLGQGGMGTVFRAYKPNLDRTVAIKVVSEHCVSNAAYVQRFHAEMRTMAALDHPAIVPVYDGGVTARGIPYFVMKYIAGENVHDFLYRRRASHQPLSVLEVAHILAPIAGALDYLAARPNPVVHRDIKPANILLPTAGTGGPAAMLTDFGIAVDRESTRMTRLGMRMGTDGYAAPELLATKDVTRPPQPNAVSEQYSLGLVAFEMLTGIYVRESVSDEQWVVKRPVPELKAPWIHPSDVPHMKGINSVFSRVLAIDPRKRFPTAAAFVEALHNAVAPAHPEPGEKHAGKGSSPVKTIAALGVAAATIAAGLVVVPNFLADSWDGEDARLAAAFPKIVSAEPGGQGWRSTHCERRDPNPGELARIACNSEELSVVLAHFESVAARDSVMPTGDIQTMTSDRCSAYTMPMNSNGRAFGVFPTESLDTYGLIVSGRDSESLRLTLPIC